MRFLTASVFSLTGAGRESDSPGGSVLFSGSGLAPFRKRRQVSAEGSDIQHNHDEGKQIKAHGNSNGYVNGDNREVPNGPGFFWPDKKRITYFQEAKRNPDERQQGAPAQQKIRRDNIERGPNKSAPYAVAIPPTGAKAFGEACEEIDQTNMELNQALEKSNSARIDCSPWPESDVD